MPGTLGGFGLKAKDPCCLLTLVSSQKKKKKKVTFPGVVAYICDPRTQKTREGFLRIQSWSELQNETQCQKQQMKYLSRNLVPHKGSLQLSNRPWLPCALPWHRLHSHCTEPRTILCALDRHGVSYSLWSLYREIFPDPDPYQSGSLYLRLLPAMICTGPPDSYVLPVRQKSLESRRRKPHAFHDLCKAHGCHVNIGIKLQW